VDIKKFIHLYGKHKVRVIDAKYHKLRPGDIILAGDEAWTWTTPECMELGWIPVPNVHWYTQYDADMAQIRRKDVTKVYAPTDVGTFQYHICSCGNRLPIERINCGACGRMM
jgi:hypothetical protein